MNTNLSLVPSGFNPLSLGSKPQVRELHAGHRDDILTHFLHLNENDRRLRFGSPTSDAVIERYVAKLNFNHDALLGVFDANLDLIGLAHLAYLPQVHNTARAAEFGVSVLPQGRHQGLGTALLERAAMHSRNTRVQTLFVHCLANNKAMMHLANKLGMKVEFSYGDADAYLVLPPGNPSSILAEAAQEHIADFDYAIKANFKQSSETWRWLFGIPLWP